MFRFLTKLKAVALCLMVAVVGSVQAMDFSQSSNLIVYFSLKHNQGRADAEQIETNNQHVAQAVQRLLGASIFELKVVTPYPQNYRATTDLANQEQRNNARPQLEAVPDLTNVDNVILIFPNWWSSYPMAVATLLDRANFNGKTVIPIVTHEGSRLGRAVTDLVQALPASKVTSGLAIRGSDVFDADLEATLQAFFNEL